MKRQVVTDAAPRPRGPYSQGITTTNGLLFIAGQGPVDPATQEFITGGFLEQVTLTLSNLQAICRAAGTSMANAVQVNVYLDDFAYFQQLNDVYARFFDEPRPARTTIQCQLPGFHVEISAIVALD